MPGRASQKQAAQASTPAAVAGTVSGEGRWRSSAPLEPGLLPALRLYIVLSSIRSRLEWRLAHSLMEGRSQDFRRKLRLAGFAAAHSQMELVAWGWLFGDRAGEHGIDGLRRIRRQHYPRDSNDSGPTISTALSGATRPQARIPPGGGSVGRR